MKYLKGTMIAFAISIVLSSSASALSITFSKITLGAFSGVYTQQKEKMNDTNEQTIKTINCTDKLTGDGRAVSAALDGMLSGMDSIGYKSAPKGTTVSFGKYSKTPGQWKLKLKSTKSLATSAYYWGTWTYQ